VRKKNDILGTSQAQQVADFHTQPKPILRRTAPEYRAERHMTRFALAASLFDCIRSVISRIAVNSFLPLTEVLRDTGFDRTGRHSDGSANGPMFFFYIPGCFEGRYAEGFNIRFVKARRIPLPAKGSRMSIGRV